jgi:hypothetical protein
VTAKRLQVLHVAVGTTGLVMLTNSGFSFEETKVTTEGFSVLEAATRLAAACFS